MLKRTIAMILALACILVVPAFACEDQNEGEISLGREDANAIVIDTTDAKLALPSVQASGSGKLLFSFVGTDVQQLVVTTVTNKSFTTASLSNGYLRVEGKGSYTSSYNGLTFRAGGCRYDSATNSFLATPFQYVVFDNNVFKSESIAKSNFDKHFTYYGFMTNLSGSGGTNKLSGEISLYNWSE